MENLEIYRNLTSLIVEDDKQTAEHLKSILEEIFFEVFIANDGEEAIDLFFEKKPDIIFADIMMPKKNGIEFIKYIRTIDKDIKIIIITGHNTQEYLMEAVKLKLEDFIIKPIKFENFINVLNHISKDCISKYPKEILLKSGALLEPFNKTILFEETTYILTKSEFKLLMLLLKNKNQIVSKEIIENQLWYGGAISEGILKGLVNKLRKKVGKNAIESQSGYGYKVLV
jgi:DNA-binding response OmpR family regulator